MKRFEPKQFVEVCEHCGKVLDQGEERYLISTQKWSKDEAGNFHLSLINSTVLCRKCYL